MTPQEFKDNMQAIVNIYGEDDEEKCHAEMDILICSLLEYLGYKEGIDIFNQQPKWYS